MKAILILFGLAGILGVMVVSTILNGWALSILWGWFIAPVFGLPLLSVPVAIGIAMTINYVTYQSDAQESENDFFTLVAYAMIKPFFALGIGWIVLQFV